MFEFLISILKTPKKNFQNLHSIKNSKDLRKSENIIKMKLISIIFSLIVTVYSQQNIIEYLQTATGFDVCAGALIKLNTSAGIDVTTGGPYTVFCAPDTVWNPMGITDGSKLDDTLISYWIIMGEFNNSDLATGTYTTMAKKVSQVAYTFDYDATTLKITDAGGNLVDTTTLTEASTPGNIWITNTAVIYPGMLYIKCFYILNLRLRYT